MTKSATRFFFPVLPVKKREIVTYFQSPISREPHCGVGSLPSRDGSQPPVNPTDPFLFDNLDCTMYQPAVFRIRRFRIIDQFSPTSKTRSAHSNKKREIRGWVLYLIVSEGVTAKSASHIPAPNPAKRLLGPLNFPSPSTNMFLNLS